MCFEPLVKGVTRRHVEIINDVKAFNKETTPPSELINDHLLIQMLSNSYEAWNQEQPKCDSHN